MSQHAVSRFIVKHLEERRQRVLEKMEKGMKHEDYLVEVGRARELRELMSFVPELIKQLDGDDDDDGNQESGKEVARGTRRTARKNGNRSGV